jgi:hypothetical protein
MRKIMMSGAAAAALVTALLASGPAEANDRDLKALQLGAGSCETRLAGLTTAGIVQISGLQGGDEAPPGGAGIGFPCQLPLNNVDLGGTTNDNDISSFSVYYKDGDGLGTGKRVEVILRSVALQNGAPVSRALCSWSSNTNGTGTTGWAVSNHPCTVDLAATTFYWFEVAVRTFRRVVEGASASEEAGFMGIRFP